MRAAADLGKPLDLSLLENKSILVTGGASGLGALIADSFATHGAHVTIADINGDLAKGLIAELAAKGHHVNFVATDVTDWTSQVQAFKSAIIFSGRRSIDIVVAAAGLAGSNFVQPQEAPPSLDTDPLQPPKLSQVLDVNAKGVLFTSKLAQHYFALPPSSRNSDETWHKTLIVISSLAGYLELNDAVYTASKWAVRGMFRSIRSKMEDLGYRVNLIAPWVMETPMSKPLAEINRKNGFPVGDANNVAKAVIRCATDDSILGRAIGVGATETFDLRDDLDGLNSGIAMKDFNEKEAKGFMAFFGHKL